MSGWISTTTRTGRDGDRKEMKRPSGEGLEQSVLFGGEHKDHFAGIGRLGRGRQLADRSDRIQH
jgi:hypothetical protein